MANATTVYAVSAATQANPTTNAGIFVRSDNSSKVAALYLDPKAFAGSGNTAANLRFKIRAWGIATTGTTSNFQALLYYGVSTTAASNTAMVTLTNRSYASTTGQWVIEFDGMWDSVTQSIRGWGDGYNLTTAESRALITAVTSVDMTASGLGFSVGALFGTGNSGNNAYMQGFCLEVL